MILKDTDGRTVYDPLAGYVVVDSPTTAESTDDILYYGALRPDGSWMIRKRAISAGTERFCRGSALYTDAWALRASLGYSYINFT